ncbi:MAG: cyclic nucleotide-binding domain-containing protein [Deltaproteobacteria bacterium]|nr:cyclic nucleotide-binding domain-containing protein [Deltaproteobacteria bacterium]
MTDNIVFSGSLRFVSLADVFQLLGGNNCTGTLNLRSQFTEYPGVIYFVNGNPINASYGDLKGIEAVYSLFGWTDGSYEFYEETLTGIDRVINQSRMEVVLDALRMLDDGEVKKLGPPVSEQKEIKKKRSEKEFLHAIKGPLVDYIYVIREEFYQDGAPIVREGKYGKWLWVVYEGTVRVTKETKRGQLTLARLGEGCFIGTIRALLFGEYERNATVTADGNVRLCILDAEPLYHEYSLLSEDFRKVLLSLDKRLRILNEKIVQIYVNEDHDNGLTKNKVFQDKSRLETDLYIIQKGTADIIGKGSRGKFKLLSLDRDDVFGKIPFMDFGHEPGSASVMVSNPINVDRLDTRALQAEYDNLSQTFRNFIFNTATNISMTTKLLYQLLGKS